MERRSVRRWNVLEPLHLRSGRCPPGCQSRRRGRFGSAAPAVTAALASVAVVGAAPTACSDPGGDVLRVRALIIEDAQGRPRVVIGAPLPELEERRYAGMPVMTNPRVEDGRMVWEEDEDAELPGTVGLLLLDEEGYERVVIGDPLPDPAVGGRIFPRRPGRHWGLLLNDGDGTERSGYGVWDSGQVSLGLDWRGREAVILFGLPDGTAGIHVTSRDGTSGARLRASEGHGPSELVLRGEPATVEVRDREDDVTDRWPR